MIADLIEDGVSGTQGHTYEPYLSATTHYAITFLAYANEYNMAESFYMGKPFLSWMEVVVGDQIGRAHV